MKEISYIDKQLINIQGSEHIPIKIISYFLRFSFDGHLCHA